METLRVAGLKISTLVRDGDLCRSLIEEAGRLGADCIFVGTDGRKEDSRQSGPDDFIASLVASSFCSVEVARSSMSVSAGAYMSIARAPVQAAGVC
jgi:hypothetical protein